MTVKTFDPSKVVVKIGGVEVQGIAGVSALAFQSPEASRLPGETLEEMRIRIAMADIQDLELPAESPIRRTPRFFRDFSSASQTARAFRGEVFGGRDAKGALYSVRRGDKFLTLAGNFMDHDSLLTVQEEIDG